MSTAAAKLKEDIAQKAKAARELCTKVEAKVEEQTKSRNKEMDIMKEQMEKVAVRQKKLTWCTAGLSIVFVVCLAGTSLLSFNAVIELRKLHDSLDARTVDQMNLLRVDGERTFTQLRQQLDEMGRNYLQLLGDHNVVVEKTNELSDQINELTQKQNAGEHKMSSLTSTVGVLTSDVEKLTNRTSLNVDGLNALNKTIREMNGTMEKMKQEKSDGLTKCCKSAESKISKLKEIVQENTEVVHTEQDKVKSLNSLLTDTFNPALLEQKETVDVVKAEQEKMNTLMTHVSESIRVLEEKLENLSSTALGQQEAHVHGADQLLDERASLVDRMKQLEDTSLSRHAEMAQFSDSMKTSVEAQLASLDAETKGIQERLKKLEESFHGSTSTCSDISECPKSELLENVSKSAPL